jgi:hypothetical protein
MKSTHSPHKYLALHFKDLVKWINQPVAIFIDDLDRCNKDYLVELLEGIQTMFKEVPVIYVIAADRRWLCTSFDKVYDGFKNTVEEPGRPLSNLFLEKTFQLSASIPRLGRKTRDEFFKSLLQTPEKKVEDILEKIRKQARKETENLNTEEKIIKGLQEICGR